MNAELERDIHLYLMYDHIYQSATLVNSDNQTELCFMSKYHFLCQAGRGHIMLHYRITIKLVQYRSQYPDI